MPLAEFISFEKENILVWLDSSGEKLEYGVEQIHPYDPKVSLQDSHLYEVLALIDASREGSACERQITQNELLKRIKRK